MHAHNAMAVVRQLVTRAWWSLRRIRLAYPPDLRGHGSGFK